MLRNFPSSTLSVHSGRFFEFETLAAYNIGKVEQWDQLLSDGMVRSHTALQNLVIIVIDEERLHPLILSTYTIPKGETYDQKIDAVLSSIVGCRKWLQRWAEVF